MKGSDWVNVFNCVRCKGQNSLYMCCLGLCVVCFGVNVYKCAHEHVRRAGVRSRQTLRLISSQASFMNVNGQSATTHKHKNACRTGSKTYSIEHRSTAERRDNFKSCPLNYGHLLILNAVCLSVCSHGGQTSPPPHWSTTCYTYKKHCLTIRIYSQTDLWSATKKA